MKSHIGPPNQPLHYYHNEPSCMANSSIYCALCRGFPKLTKSCSHFLKILPTSAGLTSRLYTCICMGKYGKNWLLNPGTGSKDTVANVANLASV